MATYDSQAPVGTMIPDLRRLRIGKRLKGMIGVYISSNHNLLTDSRGSHERQ